MHPTQEVIHAEIGHQYSQEGQEHVKMEELGTTEIVQTVCMEWKRIDHERDKCPDFFRIPSPITSPRNICPNGTDENTNSQEEHRRIEQQPTEQHQPFGFTTNKQSQPTIQLRESQESITHHNARHMGTEPRGYQNGHQRGNLRIHLSQIRDQ